MSKKTSQWKKKQILDFADRRLKAQLREQGYRIASKRDNVTKSLQSFSTPSQGVSRGSLKQSQAKISNGVLPYGNGLVRIGHSVWSIEASGEGDYKINRMKAEPQAVGEIPETHSGSIMIGLGYPNLWASKATEEEATERMVAGLHYCGPRVGSHWKIRGAHARVVEDLGDLVRVAYVDLGGIQDVVPVTVLEAMPWQEKEGKLRWDSGTGLLFYAVPKKVASSTIYEAYVLTPSPSRSLVAQTEWGVSIEELQEMANAFLYNEGHFTAAAESKLDIYQDVVNGLMDAGMWAHEQDRIMEDARLELAPAQFEDFAQWVLGKMNTQDRYIRDLDVPFTAKNKNNAIASKGEK